MAEDNVEKEEKTTEVNEKKNLEVAKQIGIIAGRTLLVGGVIAGVGFACYSIGKGHGNDAAYEVVYKTFPEIREKLTELDPAFFAKIEL